jgi:hypothetical protein
MRRLAASTALCASLLIVLAVSLAPSAQAYIHVWSCQAASAVQCYDNSGQQYNPWAQVSASMSAVSNQVCAKAITAAGNIRTGSGCNFNTTARLSCFSYALPDSWAYVYWAGNGTVRTINGRADTIYYG